jgi:hypothetical protein
MKATPDEMGPHQHHSVAARGHEGQQNRATGVLGCGAPWGPIVRTGLFVKSGKHQCSLFISCK